MQSLQSKKEATALQDPKEGQGDWSRIMKAGVKDKDEVRLFGILLWLLNMQNGLKRKWKTS